MTQTGDAHQETTGTADEHPFALERCTTCGYDLSHLPAPRTCPECGEYADGDTLVVPGESLEVATMVRLCILIYIIGAGLNWVSDRFDLPTLLVRYGMLAWYAVVIAAALWGAFTALRRRSRHIPSSWLRLDRRGITLGGVATLTHRARWHAVPKSSLTAADLPTPDHAARRTWHLRFAGPRASLTGRNRRITLLPRRGESEHPATLHEFEFNATPEHAHWLHDRVRALRAAHAEHSA